MTSAARPTPTPRSGATPEPATGKPETPAAAPEPATSAPEPVASPPEPATSAPEPATSAPEPATSAPEPPTSASRTPATPVVPETQAPRTPDQLREGVESTRSEVADTVEALAAKTDIKGRAEATLADTRERAQRKAAEVGSQVREAGRAHQGALVAAGAVALAFTAGVIALKKRGR